MLNPRGLQIINKIADGLILVWSPECKEQLWAMSKRPGYKYHNCSICNKEVPKNTEQMYRPVGNPSNRMCRICLDCSLMEPDR